MGHQTQAVQSTGICRGLPVYSPDVKNLNVFVVGGPLCSTRKARKMGWHGFVDSTESVRAVLDDLEHIGMTPPVPNAPETVTKTI